MTAGAVTFEATSASVPLTWQEVDGAAAYNVYRAEEGDTAPTLLKKVRDPSHTDATARIGGVYTYTVTALDPTGEESVPSATRASRPWTARRRRPARRRTCDGQGRQEQRGAALASGA
ncbi:hypothetical protein [Nonomuraea dietziae]|uniref:hypothetical protein n=1 Tax=Nonomuraea dietziae TaxID=65515 RepID=UPI0031E192BF